MDSGYSRHYLWSCMQTIVLCKVSFVLFEDYIMIMFFLPVEEVCSPQSFQAPGSVTFAESRGKDELAAIHLLKNIHTSQCVCLCQPCPQLHWEAQMLTCMHNGTKTMRI